MLPRYDEDRRTNFVARIDETILPLGIVYPFNCDGDEVRRGICGSESEITLINSAYIILGTGDARTRPSVTVIDAGRPLPLGGLRAGIAAVTLPRAIYWREFWASVEGGTCATLLRERFLQ
jgi:hypothetical protein